MSGTGTSMSSGSMMSGSSTMSDTGTGTSASGGVAAGAGTPANGASIASSGDQGRQAFLQGLFVGYQFGYGAALARELGYNVTGYNAEVDKFNQWIQQNIGTDPRLQMPKVTKTNASMQGGMPGNMPVPQSNLNQGVYKR